MIKIFYPRLSDYKDTPNLKNIIKSMKYQDKNFSIWNFVNIGISTRGISLGWFWIGVILYKVFHG